VYFQIGLCYKVEDGLELPHHHNQCEIGEGLTTAAKEHVCAKWIDEYKDGK
jgi:hypothetical protein